MGKTLEIESEIQYPSKISLALNLAFKDGFKYAQEKICESEILQKIRATKSDAEARRIIRTLLKE